MLPRMDSAELEHRFKGQAANLLIQIASLLQGGILSAAAFALIGIFQTNDDIAIRVILWLISVIIGLVMFSRLCNYALFLMNAGTEVILMLPVLCLFQIVPFAILSSSALGPHDWRYWYVADTLVFVAGFSAQWISLLALNPDQYADELSGMFAALRSMIRRECLSGAAAALLTIGLTVWILVVPPDWPYATAFVSVHLVLTILSSIVIVRNQAREIGALRDMATHSR